jgi:uncharacterized membrane protein YpjA
MANKARQGFFHHFVVWADNLKRTNAGLVFLVLLNIYFSANAIYVDYDHLLALPWYLVPLSPICALLVPLLIVWLLIFKIKKRVHPLFTGFLFVSLLLYGMMAYVYYPLTMAVDGVDIWTVLVLLFVTGWALQAFVLASEVRPLQHVGYILITAYFMLKAYTDTFLGTFEDVDFWSRGVLGLLPVFTVVFLALLGVSLWATWLVGRRNT